MEHSEWPDFGAAVLAGTPSTLAQSKKVQARLSEQWGAERLESILAMMRAGKLEGAWAERRNRRMNEMLGLVQVHNALGGGWQQ